MSTKISWASEVWNPVVGCKRVSEGCDHCYAFALHDRRYKANRRAAPVAYAPSYARAVGFALPFPPQYDKPFSTVQLLPERLDQPLRWRKPRRVFVCSMADLFHEDVPDEFIWQVFSVMREAMHHTFLILTKRPERMRQWTLDYLIPRSGYTSNVHLGVSVESQAMADERIPDLLATPAAMHWASVEPMLEPVDLDDWMGSITYLRNVGGQDGWAWAPGQLDWVVCGGESGPGYRTMEPHWPFWLKAQCDAAGVAFYYKQASGPRSGMPCGDSALDECKDKP